MSTTFVCDYVPSTKPQRVDAGCLLPAVHLRLLGPGKWLVLEEEIHVAGTWYGWLALDDTDVAKIIEFTRKTYRPREVRMRIGEDLVEVLTRMGNPPGPTVKLKVRKLDTAETIDLNDVPMTHENRQKVFKARLDSERAR